MQIAHIGTNAYVITWSRGEEVLTSLREFLASKNIRAGHFTGLGAAESLEFGFYNLETKEYEQRRTNYDVEILSLTGNVAMMDGNYIVHMHGVFGKRDFSAFGGHVFSIQVSGACELHLTVLDGLMDRAYDEATGLNLLCGMQ